ncbi:Hypothetical protein HDN1F_20130 [gamma proteobacterium HdN1]|nr:Hypothetical protein HDN1F_20130 [gamma proteobacterium HdN1]
MNIKNKWNFLTAQLTQKRRASGAVLGILGIALLLAGCWQKPAETQYITDSQGRALILHGINSSSSAKEPETGHMPWITEADVDQEVTEWGFNFVRLLIFWDGIEPQKGVYDEAYLDAVAERVRWYTSRGAYVMLDMHQDIYSNKVGGNGAPDWATVTNGWEIFAMDFPGMPWWVKNVDPSVIAAFVNFWRYQEYAWLQDHYIAAWQKVAQRFKDDPMVIGYDLMNEPHAGDLVRAAKFTFEPTWLASMYRRLIPALREIDQDKWLFFEPQSLAVNFGMPSKLPVIDDALTGDRTGEKRLVYAPHFYPFGLHEGIPYNLVDKQQMRDWNSNRVAELNRQKVPLLVGEFGGSDNTVGFSQYLNDVTAMYDQMGASWAWWANDPGDWGLIDKDGNENPKVNQLVRAYPRAIAGAPESFSYHPETRIFTLQYRPKVGVTGGTEIFVPKRHYSQGFAVLTQDPPNKARFEWDAARQILTYYPQAGDAVHWLAIYPLEDAPAGVTQVFAP